MADTEVAWAGLTLGGDSDYGVLKISGWEDLPDLTDMSEQRTRGDGDHVGPLYGRSRIVTISGEVVDTADRDALVLALQAASPVSSALQDLTVSLFGRTLTAQARVIQRSLDISRLYTVGNVPFALQWRCPNPLRYGPAQTPSTGLPTSGTGLAYPLAYPLDYGTPGNPGQIVLDNTSGTAAASMLLTITGPLLAGFEVSSGGQRLTYPVAVPDGQPVVIDTALGTVVVEGTADRRINLSNADWLQVPKGQSATLQFTSLGGAYDPAASLSAVFRPASW